METKAFEARAGFAPQTCLLIDLLKVGQPGDQFTDAQLKEACGLSCMPRQRGYSYLHSAIRYCERAGIFWRRVRGTDILRCLNPAEKMNVCESDRRHISRVARRSVRRLGSIERDALSEPERKRFDVQMAQHSTVAMFSDWRTEKKITALTNGAEIDRQKVLDLFKD